MDGLLLLFWSQRNDLIQGMDYTVTVTDKRVVPLCMMMLMFGTQSETPLAKFVCSNRPAASYELPRKISRIVHRV